MSFRKSTKFSMQMVNIQQILHVMCMQHGNYLWSVLCFKSDYTISGCYCRTSTLYVCQWFILQVSNPVFFHLISMPSASFKHIVNLCFELADLIGIDYRQHFRVLALDAQWYYCFKVMGFVYICFSFATNIYNIQKPFYRLEKNSSNNLKQINGN